jgi:hypothetical protein
MDGNVADLLAELFALPDREPDQEGQHRLGAYVADWSYWREARDVACQWDGRPAIGLVLTDAAGPQCLSVLGVCDRHRNPDLWPRDLWSELAATHEPGSVFLRSTDAPGRRRGMN